MSQWIWAMIGLMNAFKGNSSIYIVIRRLLGIRVKCY